MPPQRILKKAGKRGKYGKMEKKEEIYQNVANFPNILLYPRGGGRKGKKVSKSETLLMVIQNTMLTCECPPCKMNSFCSHL